MRRLIDTLGEIPHVRALTLTTIACALTTLLAICLFRVFDAPNLVALFILTVVMASLRWGRLAGLWSAFLSVVGFDFLFIPPRLSFAITDTQYFFTFALFVLMALIASDVGGRLRLDAKIARAGERRETAVARVANDLSGASKIQQIAAICTETFAPLFDAEVILLLPDADERLQPYASSAFRDLHVAQWAYDHVLRAGAGAQSLSDASVLCLPLKAPIRCRGVLAIRPRSQSVLGNDERRFLDACCSSIALALERIHFVDIFQQTLVRMEGERLRNSLLSAISHDLRTPLTVIHGLAETLETTKGLSANDRTEIAGAIRNEAEELQQLVTNLLDLARIQGDGVRLDKQWHSVEEIAGITLNRLAPALTNYQIRTRFPNDLPLVEVDAYLFERVLFNLLDNALKYAAKDADISIGAEADDHSICCFVEDNGPGLPPGDAERLFEPFTRGKMESAISGVGLGLALCRNIIAAHGGTIRAAPNQPSGARFEICLPRGSAPKFEMDDA